MRKSLVSLSLPI